MAVDGASCLAPFTPTQRDLYLGYGREPELRRYLAHSLELGTVDAARWQQAIARVTEEHALLRAGVASDAGRLYQVARAQGVDVDVERVQTASLEAFVRDTAKASYNIERDPLVRHWLVRDPHGRDVAVVAWSHVLFDARSAALLFERASELYRGGEPREQLAFFDIADAIAREFDTPAAHDFWRAELASVTPLEPVPTRAASGALVSRRASITGDALARLRALGVRDAELIRCAFAVALDGVYAGAQDFLVYDIRGGRDPAHRDVVGSFHTVLPRVVSRAAIGQGFAALREQQRGFAARSRPHRAFSVQAQRQLIADPFQVYYNFYDFVEIDGPSGRGALRTYDSFAEREVHLVVEASAERIELGLHFDDRVLADDRLLERLLLVIERVAAGDDDLRGELLLPDELPVVAAPNARACAVPFAGSIVELFERQVAARPSAVAVRCGDRQLTYGELDERSERLASSLARRGLGREDRVAIHLEPGLELPIAVLGVLKAGCAYVPIAPDTPPERVRGLVDDSGAALVLGAAEIAELPPAASRGARPAIAPTDLAYVIYTSGSTGVPKGVMIEHGSLVRLFTATEPWFGFGPDDVWTLFHSYAFDFSVWELFGALVYGGCLVIVPRACARSVEDFYQLLAAERVTVLNQTPSAFRQLVTTDDRERRDLASLRYVIFGGEALDFHALAPWFARHGSQPTLVNMYGITETTVHVTYRVVAPEEARPGQPSFIGVPIPDLQIYLLDPRGRRVPPNVPAELHVVGAGVARGYHDRPELTRERFLDTRFGRAYRSGDLARFDASGEIAFIGRADSQVKLRGYRIELGEIEACLRSHPDVRDAVVLLDGDRLLAYAVVAGLPGPPTQELQAHVASRLPEYMVPAAIANIERLPLTINGKLDRAALPAPSRSAPAAADEPAGDVERRLAAIWCEVLELERVGRSDDFFALGGHSLIALRLVDRVRSAFDVRVPLRALFANSTLAGLAAVISAELPHADATAQVVAPGAAAPEIVPSRWHHVFWPAYLRDPYNASMVVDHGFVVRGPLDVAALARAVDRVAARQAALRWRFYEHGTELRARIAEPETGQLIVRDQATGSRAAAVELGTSLVVEPFDLVQGPVFRTALVRVTDDEHVFCFGATHLISDGSSLGVFYAELAAFYGGTDALAPLALDFAGYVRAQHELAAGPEGERQRAFWREALRGVEVIRLPGESAASEPAQRVFHEGALIRDAIDPELTTRLRAFSAAERVTTYVVLCTAVVATLRASSGQERFCVASSSSQRHRPGVEHLIGFFANPLFVVADFAGVTTWRELVHRMAGAAFDAFEHSDIPIATEVSPGFTRFNFNYINAQHVQPRALGGLPVEALELAQTGRRFWAFNEIVVWLVERDDRVDLELMYRKDLFTAAQMRAFLADVRAAVDEITRAAERTLRS